MFIVSLSKFINRNLIRYFDQSRIRYMVLVFPAYQILVCIGIVAVLFLFEVTDTSPYFTVLWLIFAIFVGVPILASWHLSCLLFGLGYFGFLEWLGFPFMTWVTRQLEGVINWFRPVR
jgi:hypothetical protein